MNIYLSLQIFTKLSEAVNGANFDQNSLAKVFIGDTTLSKIGSEIKIFGNHMKQFYTYVSDIPGFEKNRVEETKRKLENIIEFTKSMAEAAGSVGQYGSSVELIRGISEKLPSLGKSIGEMFIKLDENVPKDISESRANVLLTSVKTTMDIISTVKDLASLLMTASALDVSSIIDKIFNGLYDSENIDKIVDISRIMNRLVMYVTNESTADFESVGSVLASKLITGIQSALDSDPTLRITPVLNLDTAEQQLRGLFGVEDLGAFNTEAIARAALGANNQTDQDIVRASELRQQIGEVKLAIDNLAERQTTVDQLASAFSRLKMYINKDRLVGEITDDIDYRIGLKIDLVNGNITP